ncbi:GGDEF domain-containing protein [Shewanella youngdeokensis]|uniref:diguanylate cyclase n=1 Tax=Shewanella youngdeokensis TaxID=2999068 RepID=A0ABZ0JY30_9GAMM|nr:GGDEF domain-containing protein [Shewanella sp. DAU334]
MNKIGRMGEFVNPEVEIAFRKYQWVELRRRMLFTSIVGGLIYFFAIIGDFMTATSEQMFKEMATIRFLVLFIAVCAFLRGIFARKYTSTLNTVICWLQFALLFGESAELVIKSEQISYGGIPGVSVIVLLIYLSFPPRFISVLAACLIGCGTFVATVFVLGHASLEYLYTSLLFILMANGFGAYVYLQFSIMRRREFTAIAELRRNAEIDSLTQVFNRRKVLELGDGEVINANYNGHKYSVIMIDVDNFKSVNDTLGHAVGDEVLIEVARRCRSVLRDVDLFGRFGGEEFVVFLPKMDIHTALAVGERLRTEIASQPFITNKQPLDLTISLGVASLTPMKETPSRLLEFADEALYRAKSTGKNKVLASANLAA